MKSCDWCNAEFEPKVGYQIYCSVECREESTKEKIALRNAQVRRKRMSNKVRSCKACGAKLSAYNDDVLCQSCIVNPSDVSRALKQIRGIANGKNQLPD